MTTRRLDIESGPARVIASGEVTTYAGHPLVFRLVEEGLPGRVELHFASDPTLDDVAVHTEELDDGYRMVCVNFDAPDGRGSARPVLLGRVGGDLLFFHFRVFLYGRTADRTVHYTFFRVSEASIAT